MNSEFLNPQGRYILPSFTERTSYGYREQNPYNKLFEDRIIFLGVQVDAGGVESVLDHAHEGVGEDAGLYVAANASFAGVEQRPQLERGLERAEGVLDAPQAAVRERDLLWR